MDCTCLTMLSNAVQMGRGARIWLAVALLALAAAEPRSPDLAATEAAKQQELPGAGAPGGA